MTTHSTRRSPHLAVPLTVALALSLMALVASAGMTQASHLQELSAQLSAEAEVPEPGPEGAAGAASITIEPVTGEVCLLGYGIDGLDDGDVITAGHIHVGSAGVAGDVVVTLFTEPLSGGSGTQCVEASVELAAQILANPQGYYINIHTEAYPDGAVRGQLEFSGVPTEPPFCAVYVIEQGSVDEPTDLAFPDVGETVEVTGRFDGAEEVDVVVSFGGEIVSTETVTLTPLHLFSFNLTFEAGDEGVWTVVGTTEHCEAEATITVSAAPTAAPTASPAPLLPDTAVAASRPVVWPVTASVAILLGGLVLTAYGRTSPKIR